VRAPELPSAGDLPSVAREFEIALGRGSRPDASAAILQAYRAGAAVEYIADGVVMPALRAIGRDWECSRIDIWQEHRATQLCTAALYELKDELETRAERNRPVAIGGAPEGDPYTLPSLLAQMVLLDSGWEAVNLGPNTPIPSLEKAIHRLKPRLVWLSVSHIADRPRLIQNCGRLYRTAESHGAAVAIGGQALVEEVRAAMAYTTYGDGLRHLAAFARTLHPRPKPPRRGRPPAPRLS
jgi:methanogenic corrinoid protein MtbC1